MPLDVRRPITAFQPLCIFPRIWENKGIRKGEADFPSGGAWWIFRRIPGEHVRTGEFELKLHLRSKRKKGTRPLFQHMYCTLSDLHRCNYSDARKTVVTFWWRADNWEYRSTFPNEAALNNVEGGSAKEQRPPPKTRHTDLLAGRSEFAAEQVYQTRGGSPKAK